VFCTLQNALNTKETDAENVLEEDGLLTATSHINRCSIGCVIMLFETPENEKM